jgi:hypothetical protein
MTAENLALARRLWDEGVSASAIGRRLDIGKNAVLSYAHRHGWPPRPSPLGQRKDARLTEAVVNQSRKAEHSVNTTGRREACQPQPLAVPTATFRTCQWPIGERPYRFCDAPAVRGPWCDEHRQQAFVRRSSLVAA